MDANIMIEWEGCVKHEDDGQRLRWFLRQQKTLGLSKKRAQGRIRAFCRPTHTHDGTVAALVPQC